MSDEYLLEQVEKREEEKLQDAIKTIGSKAVQATRTPNEYISETCEDCGNDLPEFRKQCGLIRCVKCQGDAEKRQRLFR